MGVELKKLFLALGLLVASPVLAEPQSAYTLCGWIKGANFNTTTDQIINIDSPATNYTVLAFTVANPTIPLSVAAGGVYTAPGKTGLALVPAATNYTTVTTNAFATSGFWKSVTPLAAALNQTVLYLSLTTAQGAAARADIYLHCAPLL